MSDAIQSAAETAIEQPAPPPPMHPPAQASEGHRRSGQRPRADGAKVAAPAADHAHRSASKPTSLDTVMRIPVTLQVIIGEATMPVANLMKLGRGQVVALDHRVGEPVDVVVNGRVIARGEVVVVDDDTSRFGVSLTELVGAVHGEER